MEKQNTKKEILESAKIDLSSEAAKTILDFIDSRLHSLTATSHIDEYAISNYFDLKGLEQYKTKKIKKEGTGENSIIKHDRLSVAKFHATHSLLHLLFAWQELGQAPLEKFTHGNRDKVTSAQRDCPPKVNLSAILDSISSSAIAYGHFKAFVLIAEATREKPYSVQAKIKLATSPTNSPPDITSSLVKTLNSRTSSKKAAQKRWEEPKENYRNALELIEHSICAEGKYPKWMHSDFANWVLNQYKDENGNNPFKMITDNDGKIIQQGLSKQTLLKKTAEMFRHIGLENRIKGVRQK